LVAFRPEKQLNRKGAGKIQFVPKLVLDETHATIDIGE
jgi:hypothetical protein